MPSSEVNNQKILITGGLGFIGYNTALHFAAKNQVFVVDDCSRAGVQANLNGLSERRIGFSKTDVASLSELRRIYASFQPDVVIHLAAQPTVTRSISSPLHDFQTNLVGSMNVLEIARQSVRKPILLYASTQGIYGRRASASTPQAFSESDPLSFRTPYGCSKGGADQYFLDYARTYGLPTVVFRQSSIY
jgi:CDP-paratose 2-epimerase